METVTVRFRLALGKSLFEVSFGVSWILIFFVEPLKLMIFKGRESFERVLTKISELHGKLVKLDAFAIVTPLGQKTVIEAPPELESAQLKVVVKP